MNKINWESCKAFCRSWWPSIKDFLRDLIHTIGSFLCSSVLAFCLASTITVAYGPFNAYLFFGSWVVAWIILRIIRALTVHNMDFFAGAVNVTNLQSAFTFILDGIISCFTLGRRLSEDGNISSPLTLIVLGVLWMILFLSDMICAIKRNREKALLAISTLEELSTRLTDEDTKCVSIVARRNDEPERVFYWVPVDHDPTEDELDE